MKSNFLKKNIWDKSQYYEKIAKLDDLSHPGFKKAKLYCKNARTILDVGCGNGSKLHLLGSEKTKKTGCEIGEAGIELGKKKYHDIKFVKLDDEKLPFENGEFDRVTSFFVLEHTDNYLEILNEMCRVLKPGGLLILLAPNFGSPNRSSPSFSGSRFRKFITGAVNDFFISSSLHWQKVDPRIESIEQFQPDLDTTTEPYLGSLLNFLRNKQFKIVESTSFWNMELTGAGLAQTIFRKLGELGIYPFNCWGPHLFVVAQKTL